MSPFRSVTWLLAVACCACSSSKSHALSCLRLSLPVPVPAHPCDIWQVERWPGAGACWASAYATWVLNPALNFHSGCQTHMLYRPMVNQCSKEKECFQCLCRVLPVHQNSQINRANRWPDALGRAEHSLLTCSFPVVEFASYASSCATLLWTFLNFLSNL